jgi:hypothetical protein
MGKCANIQKTVKFQKYHMKFFFPSPRPLSTLTPKYSQYLYYIAGLSRKQKKTHILTSKMDQEKAVFSPIRSDYVVPLYVAKLGHRKLPFILSKGENVHRPEAINPPYTKTITSLQQQSQKPQNLQKTPFSPARQPKSKNTPYTRAT